MGVVVHLSVTPLNLIVETLMMNLKSFVLAIIVNSATSIHLYHHPGYHGYHGYHHKCSTQLELVTKNLCRVEIEKECTTKTKTFVKITGYEDTDCKEIEVCKHDLYHHGYHGYFHKREAEADAHGYYIECEKEMKTVCKKTPVKEEVNKEFELCRPKPNEVCEEKEIKVPRLVCEDETEEKDEATDVESI